MQPTIDPTRVSPIQEYLEQLHREFLPERGGAVATYIPELAKAEPDLFGICLVTSNGSVYETRDSRAPFTIQSISKPFVYGLALEDHGRAHTLTKVGVEPTGDAFNSISLDPGTGRPRNPMINAGAIAAAGLVSGKSPATQWRRVLEMLGHYAGRPLTLDESVYRSESETGHRNRAIGYMLRNFEILTDDPTPVVELYFKQCSVSVDCRDLAVMAATLANRGVNPLTGRHAVRGEYVESILSVMGSCGMYDYTGEWIFKVGMPAKSGVAGGVIAVLPGQLGVGVFSPRLDAKGNSVRGIAVCNELSRHLDLHLFNRPAFSRTAIRLKFTGAELNSSRSRGPDELEALRKCGASIRGYQLQGNLAFATVETVLRDVMEGMDAASHLIFDFKRVLSINESACRLLWRLHLKFAALGKPMVYTHLGHAAILRRFMKAKLGDAFATQFREFEDNDMALEWCEDRVIETTRPRPTAGPRAEIEYELTAGMSPVERSVLGRLFRRRHYPAAEVLMRVGDAAREVYFLARGEVSVKLPLAGGGTRRLATFSEGMAFGEMAFLDGAPRSAMIVADTDIECDILTIEEFEALGSSHPGVKIKLLRNLSLGLCRRLRKANRELSLFD
jgi:glutaminase